MKNTSFGHYTTQTGLMGIISSESLWATNIKFLNDEHEFQHALDLIKEIISVSNIKPGHRDHSIYEKYIADLEKQLKSLNGYKSEAVFTLSFSEEPDLLSQWRGYCPENNGYCLLFNIKSILKQAKNKYKDAFLVKCVYEKNTKVQQIKDILNLFWKEYLNHDDKDDKKNIIEDLSKEIMLLASYFKHPSFSEEKEHRIVVILEYSPDNDIRFREGKFSIIPYIEIPASREDIRQIYIGPTSNKELSERALEAFIDNSFELPLILGNLKVKHSKTPYRPW